MEQENSQDHNHEHRSDTILLPASTPWPMVLSLGLALLITGMVTHWVVSLLGLVLTLRSIFGWFFDMFPHEQHVAVPIQAGVIEITSTRTTRSQLPVGVDHRKLLPIETFSITAGLKGGIIGGIAMIVPAALFGLIRYHSVW